MTGVNAGSKVDVDDAKLIGDNHALHDKPVSRPLHVQPQRLSNHTSEGQIICVSLSDQVLLYPELLFQNLIIAPKSAEQK